MSSKIQEMQLKELIGNILDDPHGFEGEHQQQHPRVLAESVAFAHGFGSDRELIGLVAGRDTDQRDDAEARVAERA